MGDPKDEAVAHVDPSVGYDLQQAVIETNEAVQRLADIMSQAVAMRLVGAVEADSDKA